MKEEQTKKEKSQEKEECGDSEQLKPSSSDFNGPQSSPQVVFSI
jgi:hypothetical protein